MQDRGFNVIAPAAGMSRTSLVIAAFSTAVEWYDFTLYLYFATVLSRVFFGTGDMALATALGGFAVAYLMRPLGAAVFGHIGERVRCSHLGWHSFVVAGSGCHFVALMQHYSLPT